MAAPANSEIKGLLGDTSRADVVAEVMRHVEDLGQIEAELATDNAAVVRKVAPGRAEYGTAPEVGAIPNSLPPLEEAARRRLESYVDASRTAVARLRQDVPAEELTQDELDGLEAIVLLMARPAILVQDGHFFAAPEPWGADLETRRPVIESVMKSVGRIEVTGHPMFDWIGTGWLAAENVIMTNRHVANEFAKADGASWTFWPGMKAQVDYNEELSPGAPQEFTITGIIGVHDKVDLALLRCETAAAAPQPLSIARRPVVQNGRKVYVVGYPASDSRRNDPAEMRRIFSNIYDVKRLQPGAIREVDNAQPLLTHDCSTLGGNSGSCVVDLETSQVLGLHFGGRYLKGNLAVALWKLAGDPLLRSAGINFS
ncbi:trypsin-like serine peptidase [Lentzea sp. HUAS TT2]|uniref:trypsin-like serine peptidase n=1 Tax=Lentzea sp. HUAS TT2 TaxID=3447454 RepID=UPI003F6F0628